MSIVYASVFSVVALIMVLVGLAACVEGSLATAAINLFGAACWTYLSVNALKGVS